MCTENEKIQPRPQKDIFLLISLLALVLFVAVIIWLALVHYRRQVEVITLNENRFLTTEWHLLSELKVQTDQKLLEKENEIAALNRRFLELARGNTSAWELQQVQIRLQQARAEREEILAYRNNSSTQVDSKQNAWLTELLPPENQSALVKVMQEQNESLTAKLEEARLYIEGLEREFTLLTAHQEELEQEYAITIAEKLTQISKLSGKFTRLNQAAHSALADLQQKAQEIAGRENPRIEDIKTRTLVRALVSSPAIQADYPDLLEALDRYFEVYGLQERLAGRLEAYAKAITALGPLTREPAAP